VAEPERQKVEAAHPWRQRRRSRGELVPGDASAHDWLEGRGERLYLIHMIDDATSELPARFVPGDSTGENMRLRGTYPERHGRPLSFYTDKARAQHRPDRGAFALAARGSSSCS
jgi:hypothetical protein